MEKVEFRVWDKKNKRYLNKVDNPVVIYDTGETAVRIGNPCNGEVELLYSGNYEIELFTGLFDKNGRKIYAGDIVRLYDRFVSEITWQDNYCGFRWYNEEDGYCGLGKDNEEYYEVIGNINENKELLKD